jgi:hypothetical protein
MVEWHRNGWVIVTVNTGRSKNNNANGKSKSNPQSQISWTKNISMKFGHNVEIWVDNLFENHPLINSFMTKIVIQAVTLPLMKWWWWKGCEQVKRVKYDAKWIKRISDNHQITFLDLIYLNRLELRWWRERRGLENLANWTDANNQESLIVSSSSPLINSYLSSFRFQFIQLLSLVQWVELLKSWHHNVNLISGYSQHPFIHLDLTIA